MNSPHSLVFSPSSCVVFCTLEDPGCQNNTRLANPIPPGYRVDPNDSSYVASLLCEHLNSCNVKKCRWRLLIIFFFVCYSAGKPTCECDRGVKWDWSVNGVGGTSRKAQRGAAGLHGGVQHPRRTAGESWTITSGLRQTDGLCHLILTTVAFSMDSFMWTLDWTPSCQSTCPCRCPTCLSEYVPIPGQGGGPGPPHRRWVLSVLVSGRLFM